MSRPIDLKPLLLWLVEIERMSGVFMDGVAVLSCTAALNQDDPATRHYLADLALKLTEMGYRMTRYLDSKADGTPAAATDPVALPNVPSGPQLDRLIYRGAIQHIADLSRFTGNVARCSTPESHRKTAELLRDYGIQLAGQMDEILHPATENQPLALRP